MTVRETATINCKHGVAPHTVSVTVVNPLGRALQDYTTTLVHTLEATGARVDRHDVDEPSASGARPAVWLTEYCRTLRRARRRRADLVIVTWPVIGYLDLVLFRLVGLAGRTAALIVHDPVPLVASFGLGPVARRVARLLGSRAQLIAHGDEAITAIAAHGFRTRTHHLPHPVKEPVVRRPAAVGTRPTVRVLGSWKPDRDLEVLQAIAELLPDEFALEIHGRRWPTVPGWRVSEQFVSENRFDELVRTASVVLVPYRRVFQSGIAVRALELGTPFVGPDVSAHRELYPGLRHLLVDPTAPLDVRAAAWVTAIESALQVDADTMARTSAAAAAAAHAAWSQALERSAR